MITLKQAKKVLTVVDHGLCSGLGKPVPGQMCIEAAVCYALGEPHSDSPSCVAASVRAFKIILNDSSWSSNTARSAGMRKLAVAQLGSRDSIDEVAFSKELAKLTIQRVLPVVLRCIGLTDAADRCEKEGTVDAADYACVAAYYARAADYACAADAAADAARSAARSAAYYAADAARSAADYAADYACDAADAYSAADAARSAADYAADAARSAADYAADYACAAADASAAYSAADAARASVASVAYSASVADNLLTISAGCCLDALRTVNAPGIALLTKLGL